MCNIGQSRSGQLLAWAVNGDLATVLCLRSTHSIHHFRANLFAPCHAEMKRARCEAFCSEHKRPRLSSPDTKESSTSVATQTPPSNSPLNDVGPSQANVSWQERALAISTWLSGVSTQEPSREPAVPSSPDDSCLIDAMSESAKAFTFVQPDQKELAVSKHSAEARKRPYRCRSRSPA
jgi:hypothetical protein